MTKHGLWSNGIYIGPYLRNLSSACVYFRDTTANPLDVNYALGQPVPVTGFINVYPDEIEAAIDPSDVEAQRTHLATIIDKVKADAEARGIQWRAVLMKDNQWFDTATPHLVVPSMDIPAHRWRLRFIEEQAKRLGWGVLSLHTNNPDGIGMNESELDAAAFRQFEQRLAEGASR